jgi:O-antigen/teichoic acid export membrane protein
MGPCAVIDVVKVVSAVTASYFLIPPFGAVGAVVATAIANALSLVLSATWGHRLTPMPIPFASWLKTALATVGMVLIMQLVPARDTLLGFVAAVLAGAGSYVGISALTRFAEVRAQLRGRVAWLTR